MREAARIEFDPFSDAGPVPSPCISICRMNEASGLCEGCQRTIDEIVRWGGADDSYKRRVWAEIHMRRKGS
ncbi:MAG TPA: DUF1289 domain-containing protein [Burkholderiaceae bacterium]